jgi:hypothetical protein
LVASALVAGTTSKEANTVERVDHSWEDILGTSIYAVSEKGKCWLWIEAEGQMKNEDRVEIQQGKENRRKAEAAKENKAVESKK